MVLALVAAAALHQTPLAVPALTPSVRLVEIERELEVAPRGWPTAPTATMITSLGAGTICGGLSVLFVSLSFSGAGFSPPNPLLLVPGGILFISAFASLAPAIVSFIVAAVIAADRTAHVRKLIAEREELVLRSPIH